MAVNLSCVYINVACDEGFRRAVNRTKHLTYVPNCIGRCRDKGANKGSLPRRLVVEVRVVVENACKRLYLLRV